MIRKQLYLFFIILYGLLIFGSVGAFAVSDSDAITYQIDYVEAPKNNEMKIKLIFNGIKGSLDSYELDAYKAVYEFGTNKLLNVEYESISFDKPFDSSSEHRVSLSVDLSLFDAKMFKTKVLFFDKNNELKPILVTPGGTNEWPEFQGVPEYYNEESDRVIANIYQLYSEKRDHEFLTFGVMTDSHVGINIPEEKLLKDSLHHGIYALNSVGTEIGCDFIVHLGDTTWKNNLDTYDSYAGSVYTTDAFKKASDYHNSSMLLIGNHDQTNDHTRQWTAIGQYNDFEQTGLNKKRSYGYTDFADKKVRIIALNTCDYLNGTGSYGVSYEQRDFLMKSLDLSSKEDAAEWKILILSHIPLDFYYKSAQWTDYDVTKDVIGILKAYEEGGSYTIKVNSLWKRIHNDTITKSTLTCNYAGKNQAKIIGNIHGHLHNDCYGTLAYTNMEGERFTTNIVRVSTPNTAFYGAKAISYPDNGDYVAQEIKKVANTAKDTSVTFYLVDLTDSVIYSYAYGAGNDRIILY